MSRKRRQQSRSNAAACVACLMPAKTPFDLLPPGLQPLARRAGCGPGDFIVLDVNGRPHCPDCFEKVKARAGVVQSLKLNPARPTLPPA
jgi:hypothetical protein